ncbi:hypothetical protein H8959_016153 [Pygathrix nigripes]
MFEHMRYKAERLSCVSSKQEVTQIPAALSVPEGDNLVLNCSFTDSAIYNLQWFRQDPGKGLTSLLLIQSSQREQTSGRLNASLDKSSRHSTLYITASEPGDSATYLCANKCESSPLKEVTFSYTCGNSILGRQTLCCWQYSSEQLEFNREDVYIQ